MSGISVDINELEQFAAKLEIMCRDDTLNSFFEECAKELAARLLRKVVKRTPVGDYTKETVVVAKRSSKNHKKGEKYTKRVNPSGKVGGTLRRGWTSATEEEARKKGKPDIDGFLNKVQVNKVGNDYQITIDNPVSYAPYVEYGHRTRNHKSWVDGRFMLTISENELNRVKERIIAKKIEDFLRRGLGD